MSESTVYISYSRPDTDAARRLATYLQAAGIDVWWDLELRPGESFAHTLTERLDQAKAVIVLWSERSSQSEWVRSEAKYAARNEKYIPIAIEPGVDIPRDIPRDHRVTLSLAWSPSSAPTSIWPQLSARLAQLDVDANETDTADRLEPQPLPTAKGYVFISHVEEDIPVVAKTFTFLRTRGYAYWTYHESDRDYQKPTVLEIEERMNDCALVLTVISPGWKRSEWTHREPAFAREIRKPMFHLRFRNPGPTLAIAGDTSFDFERGEEDAFRKLGIELDKKGL